MASSLREVLDMVVEAVASDAGVSAFCTENFGKPVKVFRGFDPADPWKEEDCPLVGVAPGSRSRNDGAFYLGEREVLIRCVVVERGVETSDGVTAYKGIDLADELADLVEAAVSSALAGAGVPFSQVPDDPDGAGPFPFWTASWKYAVQVRSIVN